MASNLLASVGYDVERFLFPAEISLAFDLEFWWKNGVVCRLKDSSVTGECGSMSSCCVAAWFCPIYMPDFISSELFILYSEFPPLLLLRVILSFGVGCAVFSFWIYMRLCLFCTRSWFFITLRVKTRFQTLRILSSMSLRYIFYSKWFRGISSEKFLVIQGCCNAWSTVYLKLGFGWQSFSTRPCENLLNRLPYFNLL